MATKKIIYKNGRAKTLENIEWFLKASEKQIKNTEAFKKSFFGSKYINKNKTMSKNNHTPDRQLNPDDHERTKSCHDCNGNKEIVIFDENDEPDTETCPTCKGDGFLEIEDNEQDW